LRRRIELRGRAFEATIPDTYLAELNTLYEEWVSTFALAPVLPIPADELDFVSEVRDLETILQAVLERLSDRQPDLFPSPGA
jgi:deoxyadenosine/deoxycytidine kinase